MLKEQDDGGRGDFGCQQAQKLLVDILWSSYVLKSGGNRFQNRDIVIFDGPVA